MLLCCLFYCTSVLFCSFSIKLEHYCLTIFLNGITAVWFQKQAKKECTKLPFVEFVVKTQAQLTEGCEKRLRLKGDTSL